MGRDGCVVWTSSALTHTHLSTTPQLNFFAAPQRLGLEGTEEGAAALKPWTAKLDDAFLEELGGQLEAKAEEVGGVGFWLKRYEDEGWVAHHTCLFGRPHPSIAPPDSPTHHTPNNPNNQARLAQEAAMYDAVQPYEEKASLDEVPDPGSGFKELERCVGVVLCCFCV